MLTEKAFDIFESLAECRDKIDSFLKDLPSLTDSVDSIPKFNDLKPKLNKCCALFKDFDQGTRVFTNDDIDVKQWLLAGVGMTLCNVEGGGDYFLNRTQKFETLYKSSLPYSWKQQLTHFQKNNYYPQDCSNFCPYTRRCQLQKNMILTATEDNSATTTTE